MRRLLTFLLVTITVGVLQAVTVSNKSIKRMPALNSILNRQEDKINRAFDLRYISYSEYENLYYQLEDIEDYKFRAFQDHRIDLREERILNELIYNLDYRLDQIFHRRTFCGNYYQPVYLRNHYYTNHYHHYRRPRVTFSVNISGGNHNHYQPSHYDHTDYRNKKRRYTTERESRPYKLKDQKHHEYKKDYNHRYKEEAPKRDYRKSNKSQSYTQNNRTIVSNENNHRRVYNQRN